MVCGGQSPGARTGCHNGGQSLNPKPKGATVAAAYGAAEKAQDAAEDEKDTARVAASAAAKKLQQLEYGGSSDKDAGKASGAENSGGGSGSEDSTSVDSGSKTGGPEGSDTNLGKDVF